MKNFFFFFKLFFKFLAENRNFSKKWRGLNIDQSAMCCMFMDLTLQVLQTNGKLFFFSNFRIFFFFNEQYFLKIKVALGL